MHSAPANLLPPLEGCTGIDLPARTMSASLRDQFGYGIAFGPETKNNNNAIPRLVANGLLTRGANATSGRALLEDIVSGNAPSWLRAIAQTYAVEELDWLHDSEWPRWMSRE